MRTNPGRLVCVVVLCASVVGACGGSGKSTSATAPSAPPQTPAPATSVPKAPAHQTPEQLLKAMRAAFGHVRSFRLQGTLGGRVRPVAVRVQYGIGGGVRTDLQSGSLTAATIRVSGRGYMKLNRAYLVAVAHAPSNTPFADRWLEVPVSSLRKFPSPGALTRSSAALACIVERHPGELRLAGSATINGKRAVILADDGNAPGGAAGHVYIAASGPPLPLRLTVGRSRPLGAVRDAVCGQSSSDAQDLTFSGYNAPVHVSVPKNALRLKAAPGG